MTPTEGTGTAGRLDRLLARAYGSAPYEPTAPYTVVQARRWLGRAAATLVATGRREFTAADVLARPRAFELILRGIRLGVLLGLAIPIGLLLALWPMSLLDDGGVPNLGTWRFTAFDAVLGWIMWAVSWVFLRWHDLWRALLPGDLNLLGTDWDWLLAIVFLVVTVRLVLFPLFAKQVRSQQAMHALNPKVRALRDRHGGDREALQRATMRLYQTEKVNPLMGCLPVLVQIPIFLVLLRMLKRLDPTLSGEDTSRYGFSGEEFHDASVARLFGVPIVETYDTRADPSVLVVVCVLTTALVIITYLTAHRSISDTDGTAIPSSATFRRPCCTGCPPSRPCSCSPPPPVSSCTSSCRPVRSSPSRTGRRGDPAPGPLGDWVASGDAALFTTDRIDDPVPPVRRPPNPNWPDGSQLP